MGSAFGEKGNQSDSTNGIFPVVLLSSNGDTNYQGGDGSSINSLYLNAPSTPQAYNGQSVQYVDYHSPAQKIFQYNFEMQRELGHNMAADIAYVGSHGMNLAFPIDFDQIPKDKLGPSDQSGPTNARPYPNYQSIGGQHWVAISNYNALQATIQKRLSNGLQFNFNYTWSKFLNESESCAFNCATAYIQDGYDAGANYGPSSFDIRHMFKGRVTYQLPFGYGQKFLNNNSILAEAIGGWQTAATIMVQTGSPFTPIMENNNSYANVTHICRPGWQSEGGTAWNDGSVVQCQCLHAADGGNLWRRAEERAVRPKPVERQFLTGQELPHLARRCLPGSRGRIQRLQPFQLWPS